VFFVRRFRGLKWSLRCQKLLDYKRRKDDPLPDLIKAFGHPPLNAKVPPMSPAQDFSSVFRSDLFQLVRDSCSCPGSLRTIDALLDDSFSPAVRLKPRCAAHMCEFDEVTAIFVYSHPFLG
jgi:hypothetical protein